MSTTPSPAMQSVTLRQGESISLLTGKVTVATAKPFTYMDRGPWYGLDSGDLDILARYFAGAIQARNDH